MRSSLDLRSAWALARLIREQRIDVVHCQKGRARTLALLAGLTVRIPALDPQPRGQLSGRPLDARSATPPRASPRSWRSASRSSAGLVATGVPARQDRGHLLGHRPRALPSRRGRPPDPAELGLGPRARARHPGRHPLLARQRRRAGGDGARLPRGAPRAAALRGRAAARASPPCATGPSAAASGTRSRCSATARTSREILAASDLVVDASYAGLGLTGSLREALAVRDAGDRHRLEGIPS